MKHLAYGAGLTLALSLFAPVGCDQHENPSDGGSGDVGPLPTDISAGEGASTLVLDFVVTGCRTDGDAVCKGVAPLSLRFSAVASEKLDEGHWSFGDGGDGEGPTAVHTYLLPGSYSVAFSVGQGDGTVSAYKADFVVVEETPPGGACSQTEQCAVGTCACTANSPCAEVPGGICLADCSAASCPVGSHCAQLPPRGDALWRSTSCQQGCTADTDCVRPSFACRWLRSGGEVSGWVRVCVPETLRPMGASCVDAKGVVDDARCASGRCLPLGTRGYCSADCAAGGCPGELRCMKFGSSIQTTAEGVCLVPCRPGSCSDDPTLGCEAAGGSGSYSFELLGTADTAGSTYCAAKRCTSDADCGFAGQCDKSDGYCAR